MKKLFIPLAACFALLFISCNKENEPSPKDDAIQFSFNISTPGTDTKAAKKGWEAGDKLNLWFDSINSTAEGPDLIITFDGTSWVAGTLRSGVEASLSSSGYVSALFEGYNDLSKYGGLELYTGKRWYHAPYSSWAISSYRNVYANPLIVRAYGYISGNVYTYDSVAKTLKIDLGSWTFSAGFKVLVKNDNGNMALDAKDYCLQVHNPAAGSYPGCLGAIFTEVSGDYTDFGTGSCNSEGCALGVQEGDGIAFYYSDFSATSADIEFTLISNIDDYTGPTYTARGKTIAANSSEYCTGITLKYSQFL